MQKTDFRFEAIVHDDASTDGTASIVREYAEKYPYIIKPLYETENQYSKGNGVLDRIMDEHTHGKYVALCEGDDFWLDPLKLQKQFDIMEAHPDYSMCCHNAIKVIVDKNIVRTFNEGINSGFVSAYDAIHNWIIPTASIFTRKENIRNPDWMTLIYSGDYSLILRCLAAGKIYYSEDIMSVYRFNLKGSSATARMKNRALFVNEQRNLLLESFNKGTKGRFSAVVNDKIKKNNRIIRYAKRKQKGFLFCLIDPYLYIRIYEKICCIVWHKN